MIATCCKPSNKMPDDVGGLRGIPLSSIFFVPTLLCFVVGSQFSFIASGNSQLGAIGGSVVSGASNSSLTSWIKYSLICCCVMLICPHACRIVHLLRTHRVLTAMIALSSISVLWSQDWKSTLLESSCLWLTYGVALAFSLHTEERQVRIIEWTGVTALIASAILVMYFPQYGINHRQEAGEWQGIFSGKNVCAMEIVFLLMPTLVCFGGRHRWLRYLYIISALTVIANSGSRTGWLLTIALGCWAVFLRFSRKLDYIGRMLLYVCGMLSAIVLMASVWLNQSKIFALIGKDESLTGRTGIWKALWLSIMKAPILGYGYKAFWEGMKGESANVLVNIGWIMGYAHNGFLGLWVELGAVGLAIFAISMIMAIRNGVFCMLHDRSTGTYWYATIVLFTLLYNIDEATIMYRFQFAWMLYIVAWVGLDRKRRTFLTQ